MKVLSFISHVNSTFFSGVSVTENIKSVDLVLVYNVVYSLLFFTCLYHAMPVHFCEALLSVCIYEKSAI